MERPPGVGNPWDPNFGKEFVGSERRLQEAGEEVVDGHLPGSRRTLHDQGAPQSQDSRRDVGGRIPVGQGTADRATVAYLRITHIPGGLSQERSISHHQVADLHISVPGECADGQVVAILPNVRQVT